jgi:hypothetical protein
MTSPNDRDLMKAKRLIAMASAEAAAVLGVGVAGPCSQARYNRAAGAALADPEAKGILTTEDRRLIASFLEPEEEGARGYSLRVRLSRDEHGRLQDLAAAAGLTMSEYVRRKALEG